MEIMLSKNQQQPKPQQDKQIIFPLSEDIFLYHIFPYLDRKTWNALALTNMAMYKLSKISIPPWPERMSCDLGDCIRSLSYSPCGNKVVCRSGWETVVVVDKQQGIQKRIFEHPVNQVIFSPDSQLVAVGCTYGPIYIWNLNSNDVTAIEPSCGMEQTGMISWSPDGTMIGSVGCDQNNVNRYVHIWDISTMQLHKKIEISPAYYRHSFACKLHGTALGLGEYYNGAIRVVKLDWVTEQYVTMDSHPSICGFQNIIFSFDGSRMASINPPGSIVIWDTKTGKCVQTLISPTVIGSNVVIGIDGRGNLIVVTGSRSGQIDIWQHDIISSFPIISIQDAHEFPITSICLSSDGQSVVSGDDGGYLKMWSDVHIFS